MKVTIDKLAAVVNAGTLLSKHRMGQITPMGMDDLFAPEQDRVVQREICAAIRTLVDFAGELKSAEVKVS